MLPRTPLNTSVFLLAVYPHPENPVYRDSIRQNILTIQSLGFEPYLVSQHSELMEDANLFIQLDKTKTPIGHTQPFWKEHNILLLEDTLYHKDDLADVLTVDCSTFVLSNVGLYSTGYCFDWEVPDIEALVEDIVYLKAKLMTIAFLHRSKRQAWNAEV